MKIGIITFHRAINYGGILQAYALQTSIKNLGVDSEIIDYYSPFIEEHYRPQKRFTKLQLKRFLSTILYNGELKRNTKGFEKFIHEYIILSSKKYTPDNIEEANKEYHIFIAGSDQIWSPTCAGFDEAYFLKFVHDRHKKISYAASFGIKNIPEYLEETYKERIIDFELISVREKSGQEIVQKLTGKNSSLVLDPTLLIDKAQWKLNFNRKINENYVLIYMISEDKKLLQAAFHYANKHHLEPVYINDRIYKNSKYQNKRGVSPDEWVNYFLNADTIFTNSFHGIAFSVNFNKNFYAYELKKNKGANERIINILEMFQIKDRLIKSEDDIDHCDDIDYDLINERLMSKRIKSLSYLKKALLLE